MRCLRVSSTLGAAQAVGTNASGRAFSSHACGADAAPPDGRGILFGTVTRAIRAFAGEERIQRSATNWVQRGISSRGRSCR